MELDLKTIVALALVLTLLTLPFISFIKLAELEEVEQEELNAYLVGKKILDVPFVKQKPLYCSEASASMILQYYGFNVSQDDVSEAGYDRFEVMLPFLRKFINCSYKSLKPEDIKREIDEGDPIMIRILPGFSLHTVVIVGYEGEYVYIHDPAYGPYMKVKLSDLMRSWRATNYSAIIFEPAKRDVIQLSLLKALK